MSSAQRQTKGSSGFPNILMESAGISLQIHYGPGDHVTFEQSVRFTPVLGFKQQFDAQVSLWRKLQPKREISWELNEQGALILRETFPSAVTPVLKSIPLSIEERLSKVSALAEVLNQMHLSQLIHGCLTPQHIVVDSQGQWQLVCPLLNEVLALSSVDLLHGDPAGRLQCTPPEEIGFGSHDEKVKIDIYGLASAAWQIMGGPPLFPGQDSGEVIRNILKLDPIEAFLPKLNRSLAQSSFLRQ